MDWEKAEKLVKECRDHGCQYGLGAKAKPLTLDPGQFNKIDCSGMFRYLIFRTTWPRVTVPDGSWIQAQWFKNNNFKVSSPASVLRVDGVTRACFLSPSKSISGIGHVILCRNGWSLESHGSVGPNSRKLDTLPWLDLCDVFVVRV